MQNLLLRLPEIVIQLLAFALALSVHESAHGWMADRLGDSTARWLGRITLNPIKHIDLVGTIVFPLMLAAVGAISGAAVPVFGWAKPVPFNNRNLRNQRWGPALVGLAGPVSNLLLATVTLILLVVLRTVFPDFRTLLYAVLRYGALGASGIAAPLIYMLFSLAMVNLVLAVFNLIPVPPLDGSHLLAAILPPRLAWQYAQIRQYGMIILFVLMWTGFFGYLISPVLRGLEWILLS